MKNTSTEPSLKRASKSISPIVVRLTPNPLKHKRKNLKRSAIASEVFSWIMAVLVLGGIIAGLLYWLK